MKQCVLNNNELDVCVEASTTELRGLLGVESGSLYEVETVVLTDRVGDLFYDEGFIFLFLVFVLLWG